MIPPFPNFKKLELADKEDLESKTKHYLHYSDFNLINLWSFDTYDLTKLSILNDNLVIIFNDYITDTLFLTYFGINDVINTVEKLIEFAKEHGFDRELKLVPEICLGLKSELSKYFIVLEDRDNFDYIYLVSDLCELKGNKYGPKRNFINRFKTHFPVHIIELLDLKEQKHQSEIIKLFNIWIEQKQIVFAQAQKEFIAIERILESDFIFNLITIGIYIENSLVAFTIIEKTDELNIAIHFQKADINYVGIYQYLMLVIAKYAETLGCKYINFEQDLGIEGLRKAKNSYHPVDFLKKYIIKEKLVESC